MRIRIPRERHLMVFAVRGKRKFKGIYTPQIGHYADYFQLQKVWVAEMGPDCKTPAEGVKVGTMCAILDVYDLESLDVDVFEAYRSANPELFDKVAEEAAEHDGYITCEILHEASLVGIWEEDECPTQKNLPLDSRPSPDLTL